MSLEVRLDQTSVPISSNGTYSNPFRWETTESGGALEKRVFFYATDPIEYFIECQIFATDDVVPDESGWFKFALDVHGGAGPYLPLVDFEVAQGSETPIWIRCEIPAAQTVGVKQDIKIVVPYTRLQSS